MGFLSDQRDKQIRKLASSRLEEGEPILVWARACQPRSGLTVFQRSGFAYVTPEKFLVRWSGQSEQHAEIRWPEITAWGVNSDARGGPILGVQTGEIEVYVQLPSRSRSSAENATQLLRAFAERTSKVRKQLSQHPYHGTFQPGRSDVSVLPIRRSLAGHTKRLVITIIGLILVSLGAIFLVLPGPGLLLLIPGLALLGAEYDWAEDVLHWVREKYRWTREKLRERRAR